jgi:hypothetical protein
MRKSHAARKHRKAGPGRRRTRTATASALPPSSSRTKTPTSTTRSVATSPPASGPRDHVEGSLVDRMVRATWNMMRCCTIENEALNLEMERQMGVVECEHEDLREDTPDAPGGEEVHRIRLPHVRALPGSPVPRIPAPINYRSICAKTSASRRSAPSSPSSLSR